MKDKEKQITEMAKEICQQQYFNTHCVEHCNLKGYCCECTDLATNLYNAGYQKITEDSVVISREEFELYDVIKKGYPNDMSSLAEKFTEIDHKARKETVDKIYNYADKYLFDDPTDKLYFKEFVKEEFGFDIKE